MVSTLPSRPRKEAATMPNATIATFGEPEEMEQSKSLGAEPLTRNHHRSHTGSAMYNDHSEDAKKMNRVLMVLLRRLGNSKTFGENIIFMLNRAGGSSNGPS